MTDNKYKLFFCGFEYMDSLKAYAKLPFMNFSDNSFLIHRVGPSIPAITTILFWVG